jgi:integrase
MGKLTVMGLKSALKKPGRHSDGDGLYLLVRGPGQASWMARLQHQGKQRDFGLGSVKTVELAEARELCRQYRRELKAGRDPLVLTRPVKGMTSTFKDAATEFINGRFSGAALSAAKARLETYILPKIGKYQIQSIDAELIAECIRPVWTTKPETGRRLRDLIIRTIRHGRPDGPLLEATLAKAVSDRLPRQPSKGNYLALPYREIPALMKRLEAKRGMGALALRAIVLTAARSGEVRGAVWDEVDLDAAVWTIPAERMKMRRPHRVPLSAEALAVFRMAEANRQSGTDLIFPSPGGKQLSDMTLTKVIRDMEVHSTVHGLRSSFRDWAAEQTSLPGEVAEAALAHAVPNAVEAAYLRTTFFDKRRELMAAWGRFLTGGGGEVVQLPVGEARNA